MYHLFPSYHGQVGSGTVNGCTRDIRSSAAHETSPEELLHQSDEYKFIECVLRRTFKLEDRRESTSVYVGTPAIDYQNGIIFPFLISAIVKTCGSIFASEVWLPNLHSADNSRQRSRGPDPRLSTYVSIQEDLATDAPRSSP